MTDSNPRHQTAPDNRVLRTIGEAGESIDGVHYKNCNVMRFDGQEYIFSHRAILTLVVVSTCNAACKFCSNEITFTPAGNYLTWDDKLRRVKEFAQLAGVTKIAYTGGEPTLNPRKLLDLLTAMNPGFDKARLHTNGFGLFKPVDRDDERLLIDAMIAVGLTGVSVSVAHFDDPVNREIMRLPKSWPQGMTTEALRRVAAYRSGTFTPRLSCVMTAEGVYGVGDIFDYLNWGYELGFRNFIFRTCSEIPDGYKKPTEFSGYNDDNRMSIEDIAAVLDRRGDVERTFRQRKSDSKVDVYKWRDASFDIDESSEEPDPDPKIRRLNVMSNGAVHTSWIDPMSVLFEDDRELARAAMSREFGPVQVTIGTPS